MFGLEFLFTAALFALPLAGVPILLHLLFRKKSPQVDFSTLRFIKASIQKTAARRRVQKWLLLACRVLLLALLIWAIAQPAKMLAGNVFAGNSVAAAIVIDTSFSTQLTDNQTSLLQKSDTTVQDLLRGHLKDANVAIFTSLASNRPETLQPASAILAQWTPLRPQPNSRPLIDRIASAADLLRRQNADQKWLVVLTDAQAREFPRPMPDLAGAHLIWFDLTPAQPRSAGVTAVAVSPPQPIPGVGSEIVLDIVGRAGDSRAVSVAVTALDDRPLLQTHPAMTHFDSAGRVQLRLPIQLPAEPFLKLTASLSGQDALAFDDTRTQLIDIPPKQNVTVLASDSPTPAERFVRLALDPGEGKLPSWPIAVRSATSPSGQENTLAAVVQSDWPSVQHATRLRDFVCGGGSLILFLQPGLEETFATLDADRKKILTELLPAAPLQKSPFTGAHTAVAGNDPLLAGLVDESFQLRSLHARRFVAMLPTDPAVTTLLNLAPSNPDSAAKPVGLLFRKRVGNGVIYTWAVAPDPTNTNLATRPIFLPLLVRQSLRTAAASAAQNVEFGQPLILPPQLAKNLKQVQIESPQHEIDVVDARPAQTGPQFTFDRAMTPGLYTWRNPADNAILAVTNVQLPAGESDLTYRDAKTLAASANDPIVVKSLADLQTQFATLTDPQPRWSLPIAIVMLLLCFEALIGSGKFRSPRHDGAPPLAA